MTLKRDVKKIGNFYCLNFSQFLLAKISYLRKIDDNLFHFFMNKAILNFYSASKNYIYLNKVYSDKLLIFLKFNLPLNLCR